MIRKRIVKLSPAEIAKAAFPRLCVQHGLMSPMLEHRFALPRKWAFDFAWPGYRVALECDGGIWTQGRHTRGAGWLKDAEKLNEAACRGWLVLRVTPSQLCTDYTIDLLKRAKVQP